MTEMPGDTWASSQGECANGKSTGAMTLAIGWRSELQYEQQEKACAMIETTAKIFWSWQNDYAPKACRHFIRTALAEAIAEVGNEIDVDDANRPEIDHDTKGERGMADIPATILNKIAEAAVFVADLTPVAQSGDGKWLPNPNVMIELGWAMHRPGWERVIGVLNTASGARIEDLPFDIRQRKVVTYELAENATKPTRAAAKVDLTKKLKGALRTNLDERNEEIAVVASITAVAAKADNQSIWSSAGDTLIHNDAFGGARRQQVTIPDVPRSYMRVIPAGWNKGIPSISDIAGLGQSYSVDASSDAARDGDYGATDEGFVRYWITDRSDDGASSSNMTMFFEDTGEFWMLHGTVIATRENRLLLRDQPMLGHWSFTLRRAMAVMDKLGANKIRRVDAGLFDVKDLQWYSEWPGDRTPSRRNETRESRQSADWSLEAQVAFLTNTYNRVRNLFALERSTEAEVSEFLRQFDPERFRTND